MPCKCGSKGKNRFKVTLPGGLSVTKGSQKEALAFAARHPGSKVTKV